MHKILLGWRYSGMPLAAVMTGAVACLKESVAPKPTSKVSLALFLSEVNQSVAVNVGAVDVVVEALVDFENVVAERALAALEYASFPLASLPLATNCLAAAAGTQTRLRVFFSILFFQLIG
ncbi:Uncharacterized protein Adt_31337 [Abeliophyllum distichum]|uniref:Uncharacterized protein n=1 Tax=Abeliophyllum distichum TaxID=126358 RepID=A0ABD1RF41_9LAMI